MAERESPSAAEIWRAYQEVRQRTGDQGYGSTAEYFRQRGVSGVGYEEVRRACEFRRLREEGWERLLHHAGKVVSPRYWLSGLWVWELRLRGVRVGRGAFCKGRVEVERHGGSIRVGRRVEFGRYVLLQTSRKGEIAIGDDVQINRFNIISAGERIVIEDHCVFAPDVKILDSEYQFRQRDLLIKHAPGTSAPVRIGRGAWLGFGVAVLKGVQIGEGAVIGAHAVVREDVPAFAIAAGVPARIVGYRQ
jgi:acetyltransferase-like isoleucine patch superfamily enzyme